jgi:hypothetical protein
MENKFYIDIVPTEKDTTELRASLFTQRIAQANMLFPGELDKQYVKLRLATYWKEDPSRLWSKEQPMTQGMPVAGAPANAGAQVVNGMKPKATAAPSINTIANAS